MIRQALSTEAYGLVGVGTTTFAIPAASMVEAVDSPDRYARIPRSAPLVRGFFRLREETVAVLDTHALLGLEAPNVPPAHVLVLRHAQARYAIAIDRIGSVEPIPDDALIRLDVSHGDASPSSSPSSPSSPPSLFPRLLCDTARDDIIGVLDVGALAALPGVVALPARETHPALAGKSAATASDMRQRAVVRCGQRLLALSADAIQSVSVMPPLVQPLPGSTRFLGIAQWRGQDLPVVTLAGVTLLPDAQTGADAYLMVVECDGVRAGFPVDELVELTDLRAPAIDPVPAAAFQRPEVFAGSMRTAAGTYALVLDPAALLANDVVVKLNRHHSQHAAPARTPAGAIGNGAGGHGAREAAHETASATPTGGFLVFSTDGSTFAAPLEQVVEIFTCPVAALATRIDGLNRGLVPWRDQMIEVTDVARLHARAGSTRAHPYILVVEVDATMRGVAIEAVLTLSGVGEPAKVHTMGTGQDGAAHKVVMLGERENRRTYELIDLHDLLS
ncbi:chemotaxis protein CheW [Robbsia sp. Bb-Pol-6]|uniref:Chemotaxis protein CheW n=1 Tax=Robbsia betulipollinis TaxID=2981849 RepID=A0ABT3ZJZ8_9BURK|nr:chemotaxis protein CheW [Robbsia betulipollinis]